MKFREWVIKELKEGLGEDYKTDLKLLSALGIFMLFIMIWILIFGA